MRRAAGWAAPAAVAALFWFHLLYMLRRAVDIPYWDDWDELLPGRLDRWPTWTWLLERHNGSRVIPTKLAFWAGYRFDGFDIVTQEALVFFSFGATLALAYALCRRISPKLPGWAVCAFLPFSLCPTAHQGLAWAYDSPHRFAMLAFAASAWLLLGEKCSKARAALGAVCGILSLNANSSGFIAAPFVALSAAALARREGRGPDARARASAAFAIAAGWGAWLVDYAPDPSEPPFVAPWHWGFWNFFSNLAGWGFGMDQVSITLGLVCLAVSVLPLRAALKGGLTPAKATLGAVMLGVLAVLAGCAAGRTAFGVGYSKASRYAALASLLIPFTVAAWSETLAASPRRSLALGALWIWLAGAHADNWDFNVYDRIREERLAGAECVRKYYLEGGPGECPRIYHHPLAARLEYARDHDFAFYRELAAGRH
ncbi:MAG: hypothetical protein HY925_03045 [Elusimicrobia bacterium]|nr:hypothetical protein [Elusimicrobiota bacterium]